MLDKEVRITAAVLSLPRPVAVIDYPSQEQDIDKMASNIFTTLLVILVALALWEIYFIEGLGTLL